MAFYTGMPCRNGAATCSSGRWPDGYIYLLTDEEDGHLIRIMPAQ